MNAKTRNTLVLAVLVTLTVTSTVHAARATPPDPSSPPAAATTGAALPPADIPEVVRDFYPTIDRRTALSYLTPLRNLTLPKDDIDIRLWEGFGPTELLGYELKRIDGVWSYTYFPSGTSLYRETDYMVTHPLSLKDGRKLWDRLKRANVLTLPDQPDIRRAVRLGQYPTVLDGNSFVVEFWVDGKYRAYHYDSPDIYKRPDDLRMVEIVGMLKSVTRDHSIHNVLTSLETGPLVSAEVSDALLHGVFQEYRTTSAIPNWVMSLIGDKNADPHGGIAEPNQKWQESDFITEPGLPSRRLIFVATSGDYCLLALENGGYGYNQTVKLYHKTADGGKIEGWGYAFGNLHDGPASSVEAVRRYQRETDFLWRNVPLF